MPAADAGAGNATGRHRSTDPSTTQVRTGPKSSPSLAVVPLHRPWAGRDHALDVERRFRVDQAGWLRRIDCARRTSHDGNDPAAPYHGRWTA
jgi:hypothetical protein